MSAIDLSLNIKLCVTHFSQKLFSIDKYVLNVETVVAVKKAKLS